MSIFCITNIEPQHEQKTMGERNRCPFWFVFWRGTRAFGANTSDQGQVVSRVG